MAGPAPTLPVQEFPALSTLEPEVRADFDRLARPVTVPPGTVVFAEGAACDQFLMVLSGSVRVQKVSEGGREIVLYRVERGQTCVLTTNCLITRAAYGAEGVTETEVTALALPVSAFEALVARSAVFRAFVFSTYATRIADLLMLIEEVAFGRIDVRLAQFLTARAPDGVLDATHQDIAVELGTAREVVSRQLKDFERRGWVSLARGRVTLTDHAGLRDLSRKARD